jgi:EAL domain-containing protein (putative c-di-GMP-specific phosphodiesterase class I)
VPPAEFIPVCEESGLISAVGDWTLRTVCAQQKAWQREGLRTVPVAINVSGQQLGGDAIVASVRQALEATELDARQLIIELTETILMQSEGDAASVLKALAALGIGLAIDDFGTGYSSLSYLKHFPVHTLKIDRSFIRDVTSDPDNAAITAAIIAMGGALNLRVIAEGVETVEQVEFLRRAGCDRVQGYLLGHPVEAGAFSQWLRGDGLVPALKPGRRRPAA